MPEPQLVLGLDFGTDSVRALLVDAATGAVAGKGVDAYRRWAEGRYCRAEASMFRQHPRDYLESMDRAVRQALAEAGKDAGKHLRAVCVDATGSSPCPVDRDGVPLAMHDKYADDPSAMFYLWKDHTAFREADEINQAAAAWPGEDYLRFQGIYSSEWFWAKILRGIRDEPGLREAAANWIEECEWITAALAGSGAASARAATPAGHKALWHSAFGGLPARDFLVSIDPYFGTIHDAYTAPRTPDQQVGTLAEPWRSAWGTGESVKICGSLFDAHAGGVGCGVRPGVLVKVIGTSAVDLLVARPGDIIPGDTKHLFGMAENSIIPGYVGIEAGQAAFGDVFRWFERLLEWPLEAAGRSGESGAVLARLNDACLGRPLPSVAALDWFNGRRYPRDNDKVRAAIVNLNLGVDAPAIYQSLVIAVAFGARRMLDGFVSSGIAVDEVVCAGGVARKSPYVMQTLADVLDREVGVSDEDEACAKGSAMYAAVVAGACPDIFAAQSALGKGLSRRYVPNKGLRDEYERLYDQYLRLGDFMENLAASGG